MPGVCQDETAEAATRSSRAGADVLMRPLHPVMAALWRQTLLWAAAEARDEADRRGQPAEASEALAAFADFLTREANET